jgi:hypothetical protein
MRFALVRWLFIGAVASNGRIRPTATQRPRLRSATAASRRFETLLKRLKCANSGHCRASGERVEPTLCALQNLPCERVESARKRFLAEQNASVRAKARVPIRPRTFGGGPLGNAECPSITPAPRSLPLASLDERHPLRGSKASSRAPATKRDRISNGVATKSATVSGRRSRACRQSRHSRRSSHARPTARYGDAPCRSPRCRSRNCNRRRNLHNPAGGAATLGVWRWAAGAARRPGLVITTSRPTRGWEQDRRGDEVQCAALTPWPKKRSDFASPRRHSP